MSPGKVPGSHCLMFSAVISGVTSARAYWRSASAPEPAASDLTAEVSEGLVPLSHRLLESLLRGEALPAESLRRVPGDAVEEDAELLGGLQALGVERLVDEQLVHDELVDRDPPDALEQRLEALVELRRRSRLRGEPPLGGGGPVDRVAREQQSLGARRADPEGPERAGRDAPDAR